MRFGWSRSTEFDEPSSSSLPLHWNRTDNSCENYEISAFSSLNAHFRALNDQSPNILQDQPMLLMDEPINPSREAPDAARVNAAIFAAKWSGYQGTEPQHYQAHFNEICEIVGHPNPSDDLDNHDFEFQQPAPTPGDRNGVADVFLRGRFVLEYKKPGKNLDDAYSQALRYRDSLGNPPLLIVSDFENIRIHTNFTGTVSDVYTISLDDLRNVETRGKRKSALGKETKSPLSVYQVLRYCFYEPGNLKPPQTPEHLTQAAAEVFRKISDELQTWNSRKDAEIARFLSQLLFCMFASDMGLLKKQLMTEFTQDLGDNPAVVFPARLCRLFDAMCDGDPISAPPIKRFNGGLFNGNAHNLEIGSSIMPLIREADALDWSQIEPAIFGTLFERIYNPEKRAQHGRHYTSRKDIETLVKPVVMTPLRRDWDVVKSEARAVDREEAATKIQGFLDRLGGVRILDPACGSGNFLYVVLNLLHGLEREVITWALDFGIDPPLPRVHPRQLLGIEIDEYAHQIASVVVWIGHIQNGARVGNVENRDPILDPLDNIDCRDAIIDDTGDEPRPAEWPKVDFIVGNPPFLGNYMMRQELGDDYVEQVYEVWSDSVPSRADFCAYWFANATRCIVESRYVRVGLLATQNIRGGDSRPVLDTIVQVGNIFFAESDRDWLLDGASVHTSIIGFDDGTETDLVLDGEDVSVIHSNLTSRTANLTLAKRLKENANISFKGIVKQGHFELDDATARKILNARNPHSKPNSDVVKPFINAKDIVGLPSNTWIIDFGNAITELEASDYIEPFAYIERHVKSERPQMRGEEGTRWWMHQRPRPAFRAAITGLSRYLVTPQVSKHRIFKWVPSTTLPSNAVVAFAREDDYFFGVLHSRPHEVWALAMGTQLREKESGFRYTPTTCFETYPFPHPSVDQRDAISNAAENLARRRENVLTPTESTPDALLREMTLTNVYNKNQRWLQLDHGKLDRAVFDAYGWTENPVDLDDDTILERLLELNLSREPA